MWKRLSSWLRGKRAGERARPAMAEELEVRRLLAAALLREIKPGGEEGSVVGSLVEAGGTFYFAADVGSTGRELWKTDGTPEGTAIVKDIVPGSAGSSPFALTEFKGALYFLIDDGGSGAGLWKSDGTDAGTVLVKSLSDGTASSAPRQLTAAGEHLFFSRAAGGLADAELWKSDGTDDGTVLLKSYDAGEATWGERRSGIGDLTEVEGRLFYTASRAEPRDGTDVWMTDGVDVFDIDINKSGTSMPLELTEYKGQLYVSATADGAAFYVYRVHPGSRWPAPASPGWSFGSRPRELTPITDRLFYTVTVNGVTQVAGLGESWSGGSSRPVYGVPQAGTLTGDVGSVFYETRGELGTLVYKVSGWPYSYLSNLNDPLVVAQLSADGVEDRHYLAVGEYVYFVEGRSVVGADVAGVRRTIAGPFAEGTRFHALRHIGGRLFIELRQPFRGSEFWSAPTLGEATMTTLVGPDVIKMGDTATFTVSVQSSTGLAWGEVALLFGDQVIGLEDLDRDGRATFAWKPSYAVTAEVRAVYRGNHLFGTSASTPRALPVVRRPSTLTASVNTLRVNGGEQLLVTRTLKLDTIPTLPLEGRTVILVNDKFHATVGWLGTETVTTAIWLPPGMHRVRVRYNGSHYYAGSTSEEFVVESVGVPTRTAVEVEGVVRPGVAHAGREVTLKATVSRTDGEAYMGGYVDFRDEAKGDLLGTVRLGVEISGVARLRVNLPRGDYRITASYRSDDWITLASESSAVRVKVVPTPTTVRLKVEDPRQGDAGPTMRVVVRRDEEAVDGVTALPPAGVVVFRAGTRVLGKVALKAGVAELLVSDLPPGWHVLSASFKGGGDYAASESSAVKIDVRAATRTKVTSSTPYVREGETVTLTARVATLGGSDARAKGTVRFFLEGAGTPFARAAVVDGKAVVRTDDLPPGEHRIYARYAGEEFFYASRSEAVTGRVYFRTVVDLMVVYTQAALGDVGGGSRAAMRERVVAAVEAASEALLNSRIDVSLRLVGLREVRYEESGKYEVDLARLADRDDGHMDEVHAMRDRYGADLVSLMVDEDGKDDTIGLGYRMLKLSGNESAYGFSMVNVRYAAGPTYTLAHELGHNFGASHDEENAEGGAGLADYSHGYRFTAMGVVYHDLMSYAPGETILYYSNPRVKYRGVPTGDARTADVARLIMRTAPYVAQYRRERVGLGEELV